MPTRCLAVLLAFSALFAVSGCGAPNDEDDVAEAEAALTALPTGTFAIERKPPSGSYVARLTLKAGKKFEIEYVRRTTTSEPWVFNPWLRVPTTREEATVLRGTYFLFQGDRGQSISLDVTDGNDPGEHFTFRVGAEPGVVVLSTFDDRSFVLKASSDAPAPTDTRVLRCEGRMITAVITLDEAQRRRGTLAIERKPSAGASSPPDGATTVVYTGRTGVDDYMAYEGRDAEGNGYDFALRESDLRKTSGPTANVGLGFSPVTWSGGGAYHSSLTCTIATR
ncbi:MAG: hypothetical protein KIS78_13520 [Labilithrix sp.]|nr:hypothetical protein [Labilithrix sp.]